MASLFYRLVPGRSSGSATSGPSEPDVLAQRLAGQSREVTLEFFNRAHPKFQVEKPYYSNVPFIKADAPTTNVDSVKERVSVHDIRGHEERFRLDVHGFELLKRSPGFSDWLNGPRVVEEFYPEVEMILKERLGNGVKVVVFDHTPRRSMRNGVAMGEGNELDGSAEKFAPPSRVAHVDQTYEATVEQIRLDFREEAEELLRARFRIINLWLPIKEPVLQHHFALCDARTCRADAVACDLVYPHTVTEILLFGHSPGQRWYYVDKQRGDEVWLLKIADSASRTDDPAIAEYSAHTSFFDDEAGEDAARESVEFRTYVFG